MKISELTFGREGLSTRKSQSGENVDWKHHDDLFSSDEKSNNGEK
jgi:hypothetical protein